MARDVIPKRLPAHAINLNQHVYFRIPPLHDYDCIFKTTLDGLSGNVRSHFDTKVEDTHPQEDPQRPLHRLPSEARLHVFSMSMITSPQYTYWRTSVGKNHHPGLQ